jgi:hypothetical protein
VTTKEQIIALLKPSRYLPRLSLLLYIIIIGYPILLYQAWKMSQTDWTNVSAKLTECGPVSERIRNKRLDFFYKEMYKYQVNDSFYYHELTESFYSRDSCETRIDLLMTTKPSLEIWYQTGEPKISVSKVPTMSWQPLVYFTFLIIVVILIIRWILLKAHEIEQKE